MGDPPPISRFVGASVHVSLLVNANPRFCFAGNWSQVPNPCGNVLQCVPKNKKKPSHTYAEIFHLTTTPASLDDGDGGIGIQPDRISLRGTGSKDSIHSGIITQQPKHSFSG